MTNEQMEFPEIFEDFAKMYSIVDDEKVYTNGIELSPIFRVKQWLEQDNKLRAIETDTAYECGKHSNRWIPCSERLPEKDVNVLAYHRNESFDYQYVSWIDDYSGKWAGFIGNLSDDVLAWMPLPENYKEGSK